MTGILYNLYDTFSGFRKQSSIKISIRDKINNKLLELACYIFYEFQSHDSLYGSPHKK